MAMRYSHYARDGVNMCHFFAEGRCRSGARCSFLHVVQTDGFLNSSLAPPQLQEYYEYDNGMAFEPDDLPPTGPAAERATSASLVRPGSVSAPKRIEAAAIVTTEENVVPEEAWIRKLKGTHVTFGHGASVTSVAMPWDYSSVRLSQLPKDFNRSTIAEYFHHKLGIQVPESNIDTQPMWGGEDVADVTMKDTSFAPKLLKAMDAEGTAQFKGMSVIPPQCRSARFNEISSTRVNCSWHKPSRTAWLTFASDVTAAKVYRHFADGIFRVDGNRVLPERPTVGEGLHAQTWGVKITNVPASAGRTEITDDIPSMLRPVHVELSRASYSISFEAAVGEITTMLSQIGPLNSSVVTAPDGQGRRFKLSARFVDSFDASDAIKILNYKPLPFYPHGKLTVQQAYTVRLKVPNHAYTAACKDIDALSKYWNSQYVVYTISPAHQGFRNIKLEGQSRDQVRAAQESVETVLAGDLLKDGEEALWSPSLATNAWAYTQMRDIERRFGVLILRDRHKKTLRVLGPRDVFGPVRMEVADLCGIDPRFEFTIPLDTEGFSWILGGGYLHIAKTTGVDKVALDIVSEPRRLIITGSQVDLDIAQGLYQNRHWNPNPPEITLEPDSCGICGYEAEYPVLTRCKHLFCACCFEDMCLSSAATSSSTRMPAIRCYGNFGACKELLTLTAIQENLSSAALERVFERMYTSFIAANSRQYRYCPTVGCDQVYRLDPPPEGTAPESDFEFNCPNCFLAICSICHVSHDTILCPLRAEENQNRTTNASQSQSQSPGVQI